MNAKLNKDSVWIAIVVLKLARLTFVVFGIILLRHEDIILLRVISSLTFTSSVTNLVCAMEINTARK